MRRFFVLLSSVAVIVVLAACGQKGKPPAGNSAARTPVPANVAHGRAIFDNYCSACHGQNASGWQVGGSLRNISSRRTFAQVKAVILNPEPPMPKLYPARLKDADVRDVTAYVETL